MSTTGVPSMASIGPMCSRRPSIACTFTVCSPSGFGRSGERVENTPLGTVDCLVVQPVLEDDGLFRHEGELHVWLTDDARRVPVKLRARVPVGAIEARLTSYKPPKEPKR